MSNLKSIRDRLGMTQQELADALGRSQTSIGNIEARGQTLMPRVAAQIIEIAKQRGLELTFNDFYSAARATEKAEA